MTNAPAIRAEEHTLTTRDQIHLLATLYRPEELNQRAVLIGSAMGIRQTFYRRYASYLAERGFVTLTFDYRGIGASLNGDLWGYEARLWQWGAQDMQAALAWLSRHYPKLALYVVGHSLGALLLGLSEYNTRVDGLMSMAASHLYWMNWPLRSRLLLAALWYGAIPLTTLAAGFFPAELFKLGERLPKGIALDWARAGRSKQAVMGLFGDSEHNHYADFKGAARYYSFSDDSIAPPATIEKLTSLYPNARSIRHETLTPADAGTQAIGHHGFFRETMRETLWPRSVEWLLNPQTGTIKSGEAPAQ